MADFAQSPFGGGMAGGERGLARFRCAGEIKNVDGVQRNAAAAGDLFGESQGAASRFAEVRGQQDFVQRNGKRRHLRHRLWWPWINGRPESGICL